MESKSKRRGTRELLAIFGPGLTFTIVGFLLALSLVGPPPPKVIRLASGSTWGAYYKYAQAYQKELVNDLNIEVLETRGSTDNLRLLQEKKADIAFVQGGVLPAESKVELVALGSVYLEPLWVFSKAERPLQFLYELRGKKVAIGPEGSGTRAIALQLLADNQLLDQLEVLPIGGQEGEEKLQSGEVDALFVVGGHSIPLVGRLLADPEVKLMNFTRAHAYVQRHQFLSEVTLYRGVVDMAADIPAADVSLVAPAATLVTRRGIHPAIVSVMLQTARTVHGGSGILQKHGQFPSPLFTSFPVNKDANIFYERGPSFLYRHLSFYWANGVERMTILLLPMVGLLFPLIRVLPPVYWWSLRRRIYRQYQAISELESRGPYMSGGQVHSALNDILIEIQELSSMPASYGAEVHSLRIHFDRAKKRLLAEITEE